MVKKVNEWSPALTRSLGRPKNKWENDVKSDITSIKITNWKPDQMEETRWEGQNFSEIVEPQEEEEERTLHVSDRPTVHHQESQHCIHSNKYLSC